MGITIPNRAKLVNPWCKALKLINPLVMMPTPTPTLNPNPKTCSRIPNLKYGLFVFRHKNHAGIPYSKT